MWLGVVFGVAYIPTLLTVAVILFLPDLFNAPDTSFDSIVGVARAMFESIGTNLMVTWFTVFQALIYFRRRRERHDLTFFDLSNTDAIGPASQLLGN